jgi:hypothetical protein
MKMRRVRGWARGGRMVGGGSGKRRGYKSVNPGRGRSDRGHDDDDERRGE